MTDAQFTLKTESLEEARSAARRRIPSGYKIVSEKILSSGKNQAPTGTGDTVESAYKEAEAKAPANARLLGKREIVAPHRTTEVEARDKREAELLTKQSLEENERIGEIMVRVAGKKGFLGIECTGTRCRVLGYGP
jgi:hypothetical protein